MSTFPSCLHVTLPAALSVLNREVAPVCLPLFCSYKVVLHVGISCRHDFRFTLLRGREGVIPEWPLFMLMIIPASLLELDTVLRVRT
jgi:hypothetical protein